MLTWGRDLINLFFPKMATDVLYFSFLCSTLIVALGVRSHTLADYQKEKKATSMYRLVYGMAPHNFIPPEGSILATT